MGIRPLYAICANYGSRFCLNAGRCATRSLAEIRCAYDVRFAHYGTIGFRQVCVCIYSFRNGTTLAITHCAVADTKWRRRRHMGNCQIPRVADRRPAFQKPHPSSLIPHPSFSYLTLGDVSRLGNRGNRFNRLLKSRHILMVIVPCHCRRFMPDNRLDDVERHTRIRRH